MKKAILISFILTASVHGFTQTTLSREPAIDKPISNWELADSVVKRLRHYWEDCNTCRLASSPYDDPRTDVREKIKKFHSLKNETGMLSRFKSEMVRYEIDSDQERYATMQGITPGSDSAKVAGYPTEVIRIRRKRTERRSLAHKLNITITEMPKYVFYTMRRLCPPPDGCRSIQ